MWIAHEIFHAIFDINKSRECWCIHVATEANCDILKVIESLNNDANDSTKPVI